MILKKGQNTYYFRFKKLFSHCNLVKSQRKWLNGHVGLRSLRMILRFSNDGDLSQESCLNFK